MTPLEMDRGDIANVLRSHRPDVLVDASGPFQAMDYAVPRACIAAGVAYCDIADGREFVCGIRNLDEPAKTAGVPVISGASSVPALSGALVRQLAGGLDHVSAVEIAISASNKATIGPAVASAIIGQVGQPLQLWRGGRWTRRYGWQDQVELSFTVKGVRPIRKRLVALADVPDLSLIPDRLRGKPSCTFRAGTELFVQNKALWLASWLVRWGLVRNLSVAAPVLKSLQRLTGAFGTDRSTMLVRLFGNCGERRLERRWTLIADHGDGPEIPSLAIPLLVERVLAGREAPGARDAGESLVLKDFREAFARLSVSTEVVEVEQPVPLYQRVMGSAWDGLPDSVRALHSPLRNAGAAGEARVTGASNIFGRVIARFMGFPPAGTHKVHVEFSERDGVERWTRDFGGRSFASELSEKNGQLQERFGPLRFRFDLGPRPDGLEMIMRGWSLFRVSLPLSFAPRSHAIERDQAGTFHFEVPIALPIIGLVTRYEG